MIVKDSILSFHIWICTFNPYFDIRPPNEAHSPVPRFSKSKHSKYEKNDILSQNKGWFWKMSQIACCALILANNTEVEQNQPSRFCGPNELIVYIYLI